MRHYRDRSAEEAAKGIRSLEPLIEGREMKETEVLMRQSIAMKALQKILYWMQCAGAPVDDVE